MKNEEKNHFKLIHDSAVTRAAVVSVMNRQAQVLLGEETAACLLPGAMSADRNALVPGDIAEVETVGETQYKLIRILPRRSAVYRGDRRREDADILIAANVDCLLAVVTADYLIHQAGFPEMAAVSASRAGIKAGLFVSKWDVTGENAREYLTEKLALYRGFMDFVFTGSSHEPPEELFRILAGKTTVVTGDRGCGKTSFIQSFMEKQGLEKKKSTTAAGTHTSRLWTGICSTRFIDTPGFRDFALGQMTQTERSMVFPEIEAMAGTCGFGSCTHIYEDGCRVLDALREKRVLRERYDVYQKMAGNQQDTPSRTARQQRTAGRERGAGMPKIDYRNTACTESFTCQECGALVAPEGAGSRHRNHCPECLSSMHLDNKPGDRASLCRGIMDPVSIWVRKGGEWALIHRCRLCGALGSNRIAADDNPVLLLSLAVKPLSMAPFPLNRLQELTDQYRRQDSGI